MMDFVCRPIGGVLSTSEETPESCWVDKERVLDMITAPAIRIRYQAFQEYNGQVKYMEYTTKPNFELKVNRSVSELH
jgi:hypothetical protein